MSGNSVGKMLLFGATGDLAQRMLLPSLYNLHADGLLAQGLSITGAARHGHNDKDYRAFAKKALEQHLPDDRKDTATIKSFLERLHFQPTDLADPESFQALADKVGDISDGLAIYLSTAPSLFRQAVEGLQSVGLAGDTVRIGLEKPLGYDLASSDEINDTVAAVFPENRTFRIDHYLGKETVQNILALRFGNSFFEPVWNAQGIDNVQITIAETVGLEDRAEYYDDVGALRDMVQNHILQLLALIAMEPPPISTERRSATKKPRSSGPCAASCPRMYRCIRSPGNIRRGRSTARSSRDMRTNSASPQAPKHSSRSRRMSITGVGRVSPSICAPANGCPNGIPRLRFSSSPCRIRCSPVAAGCCNPMS